MYVRDKAAFGTRRAKEQKNGAVSFRKARVISVDNFPQDPRGLTILNALSKIATARTDTRIPKEQRDERSTRPVVFSVTFFKFFLNELPTDPTVYLVLKRVWFATLSALCTRFS